MDVYSLMKNVAFLNELNKMNYENVKQLSFLNLKPMNFEAPELASFYSVVLQENQSILESILQRQTWEIRCDFRAQSQIRLPYILIAEINQPKLLKQLFLTPHFTFCWRKFYADGFKTSVVLFLRNQSICLTFWSSDIVIAMVASNYVNGETPSGPSVTTSNRVEKMPMWNVRKSNAAQNSCLKCRLCSLYASNAIFLVTFTAFVRVYGLTLQTAPFVSLRFSLNCGLFGHHFYSVHVSANTTCAYLINNFVRHSFITDFSNVDFFVSD